MSLTLNGSVTLPGLLLIGFVGFVLGLSPFKGCVAYRVCRRIFSPVCFCFYKITAGVFAPKFWYGFLSVAGKPALNTKSRELLVMVSVVDKRVESY